MSSKVIEVPFKPGPCQPLVDVLRDLLSRAEAGELQFIALAGSVTGGATLSAVAGMPYSVMAVIGEVRVLERHLIDDYVEPYAEPME